MKKSYTIEAIWDSAAKVWVAESADVPGLCTEAATMEKLIKKLDVVIPELLKANGLMRSRKSIPFTVLSEHRSVAHA